MSEELQLDQTLRKIEFLFRYGGINVKSGKQNVSNRFRSRIIFLLNLLWAIFDLSGAIYWFIDGIRKKEEFLQLTYIAPCISITTLSIVKSVFLVIHEKQVHKLLENLRKMEKREKERVHSSEKDKIIKRETKFLNQILILFNIVCMVVILGFTLSPLVIIVINYYQTAKLELILPFLILYPFDPFQIKVWPFVYLHQFWSECVNYFYICSADLLFFACCTHVRIQFRLLRYNIENIFTIKRNTNQKFVENEDFNKNFESLMKWHQDLIKSANILEIVYSKSTLLNFVLSSLVICLTGFNTVTVKSDLSFIAIFLCFLFMSLMQVFFFCYFADMLTSSSTDISKAVYNSRWYMADAKTCKKLLIVLTRSQSPCKITASGFADVDLKSFMRVLSTAYSYFALLQTMYGN